MKGDFSVKLSVEVYPDGEIIIFSGSDALIHLTRDDVIKMMIKNAQTADWLSSKDMVNFAIEILKRADDAR